MSWKITVDSLEKKYEKLHKELELGFTYECSNWRERHDETLLLLDRIYKNILIWLGMAAVLGDESAEYKLDKLDNVYADALLGTLSPECRAATFWPSPIFNL